ncbi:MAG: O-antigen ligase family protein [Candidatus Krumholzibacteria bacterium]|nr:O-antigen ligase family protein [Candidatus Krumholzibacteria bacterium]
MRAADGRPAAVRLRQAALVFFGIFVFTSTFSIAANQISLSITVLLFAALCLIDRSFRPGWLPLALPFAAFTFISIISSLLSGNPADAFGNMKNYLLFVVVWLTASLAADRSMRGRIYQVLLVSGAGSALYGIVIYCMGMGRGGLHRTPGTFSNEMTFGGIMMLLLSLYVAVSIAAGIPRKLRISSMIAAAVAFMALVLTQTRSSWLAMFISGIVILALLRRRWIPVYIAAVTALVLLGPSAYRDRITTMFDLQFRTNVQRINMLRGGLSIFREHAVIGTGPVDLGEIYREHMPPEAVHVHGHMHNIFLHVAVTLGTLGLAAFVWLLASMFRIVGRNLRLDLPPPGRALTAGSLGAMTGFIVNGMFDWNFGDAEVLTMMLIIIGLNAAVYREWSTGESAAPLDRRP